MRMRGSKFALVALGAVVALVLPLASTGSATGITTNACTFGQFPNAPGGQSQLQVNCAFTNAGTSATETIEDFPQAVWHNGGAWKVPDGVTTLGSPTVTSATGHFNAATDIDHTISGVGIPPFSVIAAVNSATSITLNKNANATTAAHALLVENSSIRSVNDGVTTINSTTVTSATANFVPADVGRILSGTNLPHYDTIAVWNSPTSVTVSVKATATGTAQSLTVGANERVSSTRQVTDANLTSGSTLLSSASANFQASDVQLPVTGCGIPVGTYIASVTDASDIVLSQAATITRPFAVTDGVTTNASAVVTSATAGFSAACDAHKGIAGAGIPAGDTIAAVTNATTISLAAKATATATGVSLTESPGITMTIGLPSPTAPINGDAVSSIGTTLTLNPTLVKGVDACAAGHPSGETIEGAWYNPGSYVAQTLTNVLPTDTIGEISYPTAVVSFAGYVVEEGASTPGELLSLIHI